VHQAILQLEGKRFEAEINASMSPVGEDVILVDEGGARETARERIDRLDGALAKLRAQYGELLGG
jgi:hypothetical protein